MLSHIRGRTISRIHPDFTFNQQFEGCSEAKRVQVVRHQVDVLTKVLLEVRRDLDRGLVQAQFLYFRYRVEFFHRSVKGYLKDEQDPHECKIRQSKSDEFGTYCHLRLAEAKFARNWAPGFLYSAGRVSLVHTSSIY